MLPLSLLASATFFEEVAETIGKKSVKRRRENVYNFAFLALFWADIFLIISTFAGAKFHLSTASWPFLAVRIPIEVALNFVAAEAIVRADRSTVGFLRLFTIPLLLTTDLLLGYHLSLWQITAVMILFIGLATAFHRNSAGQKGAGWAVLTATLAALSATIFKWDISHYNSTAAEQIVVYTCVLTFFYIKSRQQGTSPIKLLTNRITGIQSISNGLGLAIESFAYQYAPASVIVATKRSFAVMWSIVFGHHYFHERRLRQKIVAGAVLVIGLIILVKPW
jgi:uncharacterized membrane protein